MIAADTLGLADDLKTHQSGAAGAELRYEIVLAVDASRLRRIRSHYLVGLAS